MQTSPRTVTVLVVVLVIIAVVEIVAVVGPDTALFAKRNRAWTSLGCGHGCSVLKTH